jgi:nitrogen fixation/metabolism regulation signal transduction histidine kinase
MKKWFYALILPVAIHIAVLIAMNYNGNIKETVIGLAYVVIFLSLMWGLIVLIPTSIAQLLCARALNKADCKNYQRFLVGLLNPSIAIITLIVVGLIADRMSA